MRRFPAAFAASARLLAAVYLASFGATACAGGMEWEGAVEELDGVFYVSNPTDGLWQGRETPPVRFEIEQAYGADTAPENAVLGAIRDVVVDADNNLYILDRQAARIVSFAPGGTVRWVAGAAGEGPGEIDRPAGMVVQGSLLRLLNRGGTSMDSWDLSGNYVDSRSVVDLGLGPVFLAGLIGPDTMVFGNSLMGQTGIGISIVRWTEPPERVDRFTFNALPDHTLGENFAMIVAADVQGDVIAIGGNTMYAFRMHDRVGKLLRVVSREVDYLRPAASYSTESGRMMAGFGGVAAPVLLAGGYWLTYVSWPSNVDDPDVAVSMMATTDFTVEWMSSLDLFDADGRFLYSRVTEGSVFPDIGRPLFVDANGKLYTQVSDPFPQVRRYRVVIEE